MAVPNRDPLFAEPADLFAAVEVHQEVLVSRPGPGECLGLETDVRHENTVSTADGITLLFKEGRAKPGEDSSLTLLPGG